MNMLPVAIAFLFGATALGLSGWTGWLGISRNSEWMGVMTGALLLMAIGFGSAAVKISAQLVH